MNTSVSLPVPLADGVGAAVPIASFAALKNVIIEGTFRAALTLEASADGIDWGPIATYANAGCAQAAFAALFARVRVSGYHSGVPIMALTATLMSTPATAVALPVPATNGFGAPVATPNLGNIKSVIVAGDLGGGALLVEFSADGVTWSCMERTFAEPDIVRVNVAAPFLRTSVGGASNPVTATCTVAGIDDPTGGGGGGSQTLQQTYDLSTPPTITLDATRDGVRVLQGTADANPLWQILGTSAGNRNLLSVNSQAITPGIANVVVGDPALNEDYFVEFNHEATVQTLGLRTIDGVVDSSNSTSNILLETGLGASAPFAGSASGGDGGDISFIGGAGGNGGGGGEIFGGGGDGGSVQIIGGAGGSGGSDGVGGGLSVVGGSASATGAPGGGASFLGGNAADGAGGAFAVTTGNGTTLGGRVDISGGSASAGGGGLFEWEGGQGTTFGGGFFAYNGQATVGVGGHTEFVSGNGVTGGGYFFAQGGNASAGRGGNIECFAGASSVGNAGGDVILTSGATAGGAGGEIDLNAGAGTTVGGSIFATAGNGSAGGGGSIGLIGGNGAAGTGGEIALEAGDSSTVVGGQIRIETGDGNTLGGDLVMVCGQGVTGGGAVSITGGIGVAGAAAGGSITLTGGLSTNTGTPSNITLAPGQRPDGSATGLARIAGGITTVNAIQRLLEIRLRQFGAGAPAAGFGSQMSFVLDDDAVADVDAGHLQVFWTSVAAANAEAGFRLQLKQGGVAPTTMLEFGTATLGFFGVAPAPRQTYAVTNVVTDRAYDAAATSVAELANVLGTLIADLRSYGLVL